MLPLLRERLAQPFGDRARRRRSNGPGCRSRRSAGPRTSYDDPHLLATGGLADIVLTDGDKAGQIVKTTLLPITMRGRAPAGRGQIRRSCGEHTQELLAGLGYAPPRSRRCAPGVPSPEGLSPEKTDDKETSMIDRRQFALRCAVCPSPRSARSAALRAADYTMRISHQFPPTHHSAKNLEQFAKDVKAATKGRVEVQIFGAAQLFKPNQNHPAVASGKIEAAAILSFQWGGTIPEMSVTIIPYLMTSVAKQKAFIGSEAAQDCSTRRWQAQGREEHRLDRRYQRRHLHVERRGRWSRRRTSPGVKIRGLNKLFDAGLTAMGAAPSAMPGSEVYQALQTGVLDAGFTGVKAANSRKFYEVQKFGVASNIILAFDNLVVNPAWWNGLPADLRTAIQAAADKAVQRSIRTTDGIPPEDVKVLNDKGMKTVALTKAQEKAMADAMQPAVKKEFLRATAPDGVEAARADRPALIAPRR